MNQSDGTRLAYIRPKLRKPRESICRQIWTNESTPGDNFSQWMKKGISEGVEGGKRNLRGISRHFNSLCIANYILPHNYLSLFCYIYFTKGGNKYERVILYWGKGYWGKMLAIVSGDPLFRFSIPRVVVRDLTTGRTHAYTHTHTHNIITVHCNWCT